MKMRPGNHHFRRFSGGPGLDVVNFPREFKFTCACALHAFIHVHMLPIFQDNSNSRARARCMHACMCTSHFSVIIKTSRACQQANPCKASHVYRCMGWSSIFSRTFVTALFWVRAQGVFFPHVHVFLLDGSKEQNIILWGPISTIDQSSRPATLNTICDKDTPKN